MYIVTLTVFLFPLSHRFDKSGLVEIPNGGIETVPNGSRIVNSPPNDHPWKESKTKLESCFMLGSFDLAMMSRTGRERSDDMTRAFSKDNYSRETEHNVLLSLDIMCLIFTQAESGLCGYMT